MRTKFVAAAILAAAGVTTSTAYATTLTYDSYSVINEQDVTITGPDNFSITGGAGEIVLQGSGDVTTLAWCIDIFTYLQGNGTYTVTPTSGSTPSNNGTNPAQPTSAALSAAQIGEIGALIDYGTQYAVSGAPSVAPGATQYDVSSGTQIAIWEVAYDYVAGGGYDDDYTFTSSASADAEADYLLNDVLPTLTPDDSWYTLTSGDNDGDNQGLSTGPTLALEGDQTVPEPASLPLFGGALAGLTVLSRRRRTT